MKKCTSHFQYSWWKYALLIVASLAVWLIVFDILAAPKKNERIRITCVGDHFACQELQEVLESRIPDLTEQEIKSVSVESPINGESADYHSVMATRVYGADLIVIEESAIAQDLGKGYFIPLPVEALPEYLGEQTYYSEDGTIYGILLYDGSTPNVFSQFYSGTEKCYLFITHSCVNAAGIMGQGDKEDDAALRIIRYLLEGT